MVLTCQLTFISVRCVGVAIGAILGHTIATAIAVIGGAIAGKYVSEKTVNYISGSLFLIFAVATLAGVY